VLKPRQAQLLLQPHMHAVCVPCCMSTPHLGCQGRFGVRAHAHARTHVCKEQAHGRTCFCLACTNRTAWCHSLTSALPTRRRAYMGPMLSCLLSHARVSHFHTSRARKCTQGLHACLMAHACARAWARAHAPCLIGCACMCARMCRSATPASSRLSRQEAPRQVLRLCTHQAASASTRTRTRTRTRCVHRCVRACLHVCLWVRASFCMRACLHVCACMYACLHVRLRRDTGAWAHTAQQHAHGHTICTSL